MERTFIDNLIDRIQAQNTILCGGIDPVIKRVPNHILQWAIASYSCKETITVQALLRFTLESMDVIAPYCACFKFQLACFEQYGHWGLWVLKKALQRARKLRIPVIQDGKRNDGGRSAECYANTYLGTVPWVTKDGTIETGVSPLRGNALTIEPYIGSASLQPYANQARETGTGLFVVTQPSFQPPSEIANLLEYGDEVDMRVWKRVALLAYTIGEGTQGMHGYRNVGIVVGATHPETLAWLRKKYPDLWILIPGYGDQGGTAQDALFAASEDGLGCVVNSSSAIFYAYESASNPSTEYLLITALAAKKARDELNVARALQYA